MAGGLCLPDHMQRACEADRLTDADRRGLSALVWTHVNLCGRLELDMDAHLDLEPSGPASLPGERTT